MKLKFTGILLIIIPIVSLVTLQTIGKGAVNPNAPIWPLHVDLGITAINVTKKTPIHSSHTNLQIDLAILLPACVVSLLGLAIYVIAIQKDNRPNFDRSS